MCVIQTEKDLCKKNMPPESDGGDCTVFCQDDLKGRIKLSKYAVFPGIDLVYNNIEVGEYIVDQPENRRIIDIEHCRDGRIEYETGDEFCYLAQGDLSVNVRFGQKRRSYFPLKKYNGISILIDIEKAPKCLSCFLDDVDVSPEALACKFSSHKSDYISRSNPSIEHIFSELYNVPDAIKKAYFKIKILELLLFLSNVDIEKNEASDHMVTKARASLAKSVCKYLTEHMESRITLEMLVSHFHTSGTAIKNSFRAVYGVSVYSYIRTQKMQAAALMLRDTNESILEIAGRFGYDNGSKFAKAFRDTMGCSPNEYRHNMTKNV